MADDDLQHAVAILAARKRQYGTFFESLTKDAKERTVAEEFVASINAATSLALSDPRIQKPHPPDFVCSGANGERIGFEVAELVCEEAVRRNAKGENVMRLWRPGDLTAATDALLRAKDGRRYNGALDRIFVCLFTDEPMLTVEAASAELIAAQFSPLRQIDAAFLLFSYHPSTLSYPVIPLRLR